MEVGGLAEKLHAGELLSDGKAHAYVEQLGHISGHGAADAATVTYYIGGASFPT
jgi:hypothetical protein